MSDSACIIDDFMENNNTKKRKKCFRVSDTTRYLRNHCFTQGDPCNCKRLHCFYLISKANQHKIIQIFNSMNNRNEQNQYLAGLITVLSSLKWRSRRPENDAKLRDAADSYRVKVKQETNDAK